jgi:hypothetical protein
MQCGLLLFTPFLSIEFRHNVAVMACNTFICGKGVFACVLVFPETLQIYVRANGRFKRNKKKERLTGKNYRETFLMLHTLLRNKSSAYLNTALLHIFRATCRT